MDRNERSEQDSRLSPLVSPRIPITVRNEKNDLRLEQWNRGVRDERAARCVYLSCPLRHSNARASSIPLPPLLLFIALFIPRPFQVYPPRVPPTGPIRSTSSSLLSSPSSSSIQAKGGLVGPSSSHRFLFSPSLPPPRSVSSTTPRPLSASTPRALCPHCCLSFLLSSVNFVFRGRGGGEGGEGIKGFSIIAGNFEISRIVDAHNVFS